MYHISLFFCDLITDFFRFPLSFFNPRLHLFLYILWANSYMHACLVWVGWHYKGTTVNRLFSVCKFVDFFLIFEAFCNLLLHFYVVDHAHTTVQDGIKISTMPVLMWPRVSFKNCLAAVTHKFIRYGSGKDMN